METTIQISYRIVLLSDSAALLGGAGLIALKPLSENDDVPFDFPSQAKAEEWIRANPQIMLKVGDFTILSVYRIA